MNEIKSRQPSLIEHTEAIRIRFDSLLGEIRTIAIDIENGLFASSTPIGGPTKALATREGTPTLEQHINEINGLVDQVSDIAMFLATLRGRLVPGAATGRDNIVHREGDRGGEATASERLSGRY